MTHLRPFLKESIRMGMSFGLTSGIITTLGLIVGLHSGTHSKTVILIGVLTVAIADSLSDALGIHVAQESEDHHLTKEIWESTGATFITKLTVALSFVIPIIALPGTPAIVVSVAWGLTLLVVLNVYLAKEKGVRPLPLILEHVVVAIIVIALAYFIGTWIEAKVTEVLS